ncbi:MAG: SUMF1/EgtB/PvdO family nonheme iron enzyme [Polyangiaceae bacterium]|nr:SUMF1/EgtB/PvdO family nonheme iron enzyme [Polyangiaceae bacterium]
MHIRKHTDRMLARGFSLSLLVAAYGCSGASPTEPVSPSLPSVAASTEPAGAVSESVIASPPAASGSAASAPLEPEGPAACPPGMSLVDGEYCTEVEQKCLQSWFDKSNKKLVCEVFEPTTKCVGKRQQKRFCIDQYEWPNQKGVRPEVMNRFHQAQVKCGAVGKRMCTESEWTMACEGPEMKPFPYGYVRDPRKCNGDHSWDNPKMEKVAARDPTELGRLWHGVPSGSQPACVSDFGVNDLPGNTDEVVASESFLLPGFKGKFDSIHTGGPWYKGVRNQCRPKVYTHDEGFYYYFLSFRCCAEPDGAETDPLTPKQHRERWDFSRVERSAEFTRDEVRAAIAAKGKDGHCGCAELKSSRQRIRCNTLCGTTVGPNATDAVQAPPDGIPPFGAQDRVPDEVVRRSLEAGRRASPGAR